MLGYAPDECVGLSWVKLLAENNPAEAVQAWADMIAGLRPYSQISRSTPATPLAGPAA